MQLELTEQEANLIVQICDIATKSAGLQIAQQCLAIVAKLHQAAQEVKQEVGRENITGDHIEQEVSE